MKVDGITDRLETTRLQNAETVDFNKEDLVAMIKEMTGGIGADRVIDAELPKSEPGSAPSLALR